MTPSATRGPACWIPTVESNYIHTTAKFIAERLRKNWGAGWDNISDEQKKDAIARRLLMEILNFSEGTVSVSVAQRIWFKVQEEMGMGLLSGCG